MTGTEFRDQLARLLGRFREHVDVDLLAALIRDGRRTDAFTILRDAWRSINPGLEELLRQGIGSQTRLGYRGGWRVVTRRPYTVPTVAITHAWNQAARRVTAMSNAGRLVIRHLVTSAVAGGTSNEKLRAELVRAGLGLDEPRARSLTLYAHELLERVQEGDLENAAARRLLIRRSGRMTKSRAWTIARTETADAQGYGRQKAWDDAITRKVIKRDEWRKHWIIKDDERTTDTCRRLARETTTVDGEFSDGFRRPPRHPRCRCVCVIRRVQTLQLRKAA